MEVQPFTALERPHMNNIDWQRIREDNPPTESCGFSDYEDDSAHEFEVDENDDEDALDEDEDEDEEGDEEEEEEDEEDGAPAVAGGGGGGSRGGATFGRFNAAAYRQFK